MGLDKADLPPALPWGVSDQNTDENLGEPESKRQRISEVEENVSGEAGAASVGDKGAKLEIKEGERIEVKWQVTDEDGNDALEWWGATVITVGERAPDSTKACRIRYDAKDAFEQEEADVILLSDDILKHSDGDTIPLRWRKEGDEYIDSDEEGEDGEGDAYQNEGGVVSLDAVVSELAEDERVVGVTYDQLLTNSLSELEYGQQMAVAEKFRDFTDFFKEQMREKVAESQASGKEGHVFTAADVNAMMEKFRRN